MKEETLVLTTPRKLEHSSSEFSTNAGQLNEYYYICTQGFGAGKLACAGGMMYNYRALSRRL